MATVKQMGRMMLAGRMSPSSQTGEKATSSQTGDMPARSQVDGVQPASQAGRKRFAKNTLFQYALQAAKYLFPFITIPYLTRVLGPDVYAIRAYILAAMTFAQVLLDYGFNAYGTKAIAGNDGNEQAMQAEMSSIMALRLLLCVVGAAALGAITPFIPLMAANPAYVVIAYACVCFKATLPDFVFQGLEDMGIITKRFVVSQAVATALIFVLVRSAADLLWVPALETLAALIAFAWSWANVLGKRGLRFVKPELAKTADVFRSSTIFFLSTASTTIFTSLTTIVIGMCLDDPAEISYWAIAMTAVTAVQALYAPITNSLYPHMVKRRDFGLLKRLLLAGLPVVLVGTIAFAFLADTIMLVLGGSQYMDGSYVIALVSPVLFFSFPGMLLGFPVLAATGRERQLTTSSVLSALFHIAGLGALVCSGAFTLVSVAVLRCCTEALMLLLRGLFVARAYSSLKLEQDGFAND